MDKTVRLSLVIVVGFLLLLFSLAYFFPYEHVQGCPGGHPGKCLI